MSILIQTTDADIVSEKLLGVFVRPSEKHGGHTLVRVVERSYRHPTEYEQFGVMVQQVETLEFDIRTLPEKEYYTVRHAMELTNHASSIIRLNIKN